MLWQAMQGKEQETGGRGVTQRSTGHKHEPEVKDQTRKATQGPGSRIKLAKQVQRGLNFRS